MLIAFLLMLPWRLFQKYHLCCKESNLLFIQVWALSCREEWRERWRFCPLPFREGVSLFAEVNHVEDHQLNSIAFMTWDIFQVLAIGFLSVLGSCNGIICFYFFWLLCLKSTFMGMARCFLGAVKNGHLWNHNSEFIVLNNILYYI